MEKASVFFKRVMLGLLLALLGLTLVLILREGLVSHSYLYAMALGAAWSAGLWALLKKYPLPVPPRAAYPAPTRWPAVREVVRMGELTV